MLCWNTARCYLQSMDMDLKTNLPLIKILCPLRDRKNKLITVFWICFLLQQMLRLIWQLWANRSSYWAIKKKQILLHFQVWNQISWMSLTLCKKRQLWTVRLKLSNRLENAHWLGSKVIRLQANSWQIYRLRKTCIQTEANRKVQI